MLKKSEFKGKLGEWTALIWLLLKGYKPLPLNDRAGGVESDIIVCKGESIVLVEVKWRKSQQKAHMAVHPSQQVRLQRKLRGLSKKYTDKSLRIDLVLICPSPPFIQHIENVFSL